MSDNIKNHENLQQQIKAYSTIQQQIVDVDTQEYFQDNSQSNRIFFNELEPYFNQPTHVLQNDSILLKKCNKKQLKVVYDKASYQELIEGEIQLHNISTKNSCQRLDGHFFHSQEIIVNQQFKNDIQIYLRKLLINDDNIRSELFNEIFGNLDQFDSHTADEDNLNMFTPLLLDLNNQLDFRKCRTVQKLHEHQNGTYTVSAKTCISKNYQKFIFKKIITNDSQQYSQEFKNSVQIEIDMLNYIQSKKTQVTLPFIKSKFLINKFGQRKCILSIESGIKNLEQVKKYYQNNKKYEEFNTILEFAFCQMLSKLNQMHKICQIAHSDINPQNIVVGYDLQFYFIDFGESVYLEDENSCKQYLKSNLQDYNLNIFLEKKEWKYQEIIDCDTSQLILTFLKMFDVEEKFYQELRSLKNEMKYYKKLLMPAFKRLGNYLIDSIQYIYQNNSNFNNKGNFILILLYEYQQEIPLFKLQNSVLRNLIEQMNLPTVHICFQENYDCIQRESMEFQIKKKFNNLLQISLLSQKKDFYITIIADLMLKLKSQNDLRVIFLSFSQLTFDFFQQQLLELLKVCQELDKKLLLQFILNENHKLKNSTQQNCYKIKL
ncbi:hypothetical protein ABPG72_014463 [Tetrahymena utriculariae]